MDIVMLDSDVAMLYHYETKKINQAVKRNIERFPEKFCFQLTEDEFSILRSQIVTLNKSNINQISAIPSLKSQTTILNENIGRGKHRKYLPYVFTEQGIAMLSGLLKNDIAIQVSIHIMDAFVEMRKFLNILATGTPKELTNGKRIRETLSPTPPVECLSTITSPNVDKSNISPE